MRVQIPTCGGAILRVNWPAHGMPGDVWRLMYSKQLSIGQHRYGADVDVGAHWRHLANTTELSMCGGDAALCQITFTSCSLVRFIQRLPFALFCCLSVLMPFHDGSSNLVINPVILWVACCSPCVAAFMAVKGIMSNRLAVSTYWC